MRSSIPALWLTIAAFAGPSGLAAPATAAPVAGEAVTGTWKGPFLGSEFTFEFTRTGGVLNGRYQSEKHHKWVDLRDVSFVEQTLRFSFDSKPPSKFSLRLDSTGNALSGSAAFGEHPGLPLTLTRASR